MDKQAQERVAIAKDALAWVEAGVLLPAKMVYVNTVLEDDQINWDPKAQLRDVVLGPCRVCAQGALFLAKAVRYDNVSGIRNSDDLHHRACKADELEEHFTRDQLKLIEQYFEGWAAGSNYAPQFFKEDYPDHRQRLIFILKNIIDNKGTFVPPRYPPMNDGTY